MYSVSVDASSEASALGGGSLKWRLMRCLASLRSVSGFGLSKTR